MPYYFAAFLQLNVGIAKDFAEPVQADVYMHAPWVFAGGKGEAKAKPQCEAQSKSILLVSLRLRTHTHTHRNINMHTDASVQRKSCVCSRARLYVCSCCVFGQQK